MNRKNLRLAALVTAGLVLAPLTPAVAAESITLQLVSGLGQAVAAQGNAAFRDIRADLEQQLVETLDAWLPRAAPLAESGESGGTAAAPGLGQMLEWHEQARQAEAAQAGAQ